MLHRLLRAAQATCLDCHGVRLAVELDGREGTRWCSSNRLLHLLLLLLLLLLCVWGLLLKRLS